MDQPRKFMATRLAPGVKPKHLLGFYLSAFFFIMLAVTINALQPYLLTNFLRLHVSQHGVAVGAVSTAGEIVLVLLVGFWGALSDSRGRRAIYVLGFLGMAVGFASTPLSDSLGALMLTRAVFSIGVAAASAMLGTIVADYVINADRGKANAIMGVCNGLGAAIGATLLSRLPVWFQSSGQDARAAGWSSYAVLGAIGVAVALVLAFMLKPPGGERQADGEHSLPLSKLARDGFVAAKEDVGIVLSYAAAFVARADLAVAGVFFPLWLTNHFYNQVDTGVRDLAFSSQCAATAIASDPGVADACRLVGEATALGVQKGGAVVGMIGGAGLLFAPVIGILSDRINRVSALTVGLGLNVIGYGMTLLVVDPTGPMMWACAAVIGFGQVGGVITSQVLVQQQAPTHRRGVVIGAFGTCGALGIMFSLFVGGQLFDSWRPAGPFALLSALNVVVILGALFVKRRVQAPEQPDAPAAAAAAA